MFRFIIIRHGESLLNVSNKFGGWLDVDISKKGLQEASHAAKLIQQENFDIDVVHTSALKRSIKTANQILESSNCLWVPKHSTWRLNERHYGILQGMNKQEAVHKYGEPQIKQWRRSYRNAPPPVQEQNEMRTESISNVADRVRPYWEDVIARNIYDNQNVLVVGHSNSLRALLYIIKKLDEQQLLELNIPTAVPIVITLNKNMQFVSEKYLGDSNDIQNRIQQVIDQGKLSI